MTPCVLTNFHTVCLGPRRSQSELLDYTAWLMAIARCSEREPRTDHEAQLLLEQVQQQIERYSVRPQHIARREFNAFPEELGTTQRPPLPRGYERLAEQPNGPDIGWRMAEFERIALQAIDAWYQGTELSAPAHLVHVTCAGYASPSPAQRFAVNRGWLETAITHSYHMGCYGAFPATRTAAGLVSGTLSNSTSTPARVDVVHTEYLSNHFVPLAQKPSDIVDMTLFADGFIGYSLLAESARPARRSALRLLAHHEQLIGDTLHEMSWKLGPHAFEMHLSKEVPQAVLRCFPGFARKLCEQARIELSREKEQMLFALHPGGPKIIDHLARSLELRPDQVRHSREVLREHGNMSSATVPHILLRMLDDPEVPVGTRVLAAGFGPGLTATGMLFQKLGPALSCTDAAATL